MRLTVALADDHRFHLEGVRHAIEADEGFELVGEAHTGAELLPMIRRTRPDILILGLNLDRHTGVTWISRVLDLDSDLRIVCFTDHDGRAARGALEAGAHACIVRTVAPADFPAVLRQAYHERIHSTIDTHVYGPRLAALTERELEILRHLRSGATNAEIGRRVYITEQTVKFHLTNVYGKLGVRNRAGAVNVAMREGFGIYDDDIPADGLPVGV